MADRTSAHLFGLIFETIDEHVADPDVRRSLAGRFWALSDGYDFSPCQMGAEEALQRLGLMRLNVDGVPVYGPIGGAP